MPAMMPFTSNEDLTIEEQAKRDALSGLSPQPGMSSLASYIARVWEANKNAKIDIERRLFKCQRQRQGEYEPEDLAVIRQSGGSDIYMMLTGIKCRSIEDAIIDAMLPAGERPFQVDATPVPDLGEDAEQIIREQVDYEVVDMLSVDPAAPISERQLEERIEELRDLARTAEKERAERKASRQEDLIDDAFTEGEFYDELKKFIKDFSTFPTAFFKGPEVRKRRRLVWQGEGPKKVPVAGEKILREYRRVSPFDMYPSPGAKSINDGPFCERLRLRRKDLYAVVGVEGFDDTAIAAVLNEYRNGGLNHWLWTDQERARLEGRDYEQNDPDAVIDAVEMWGTVPGETLIEWGMQEELSPERDYDIRAWLIGSHVVMARLNPHPLGNRTYYSASFEEINDSVWGKAPAEIMRDCQRICNAAARACVDNMGIASGPQVGVETYRLDKAETDSEDIYPWKVWQFDKPDPGSGSRPPLLFYQPNLVTAELIRIFDKFYMQAGEQLGVPAYEHGSMQTKGAGETKGGLQMLLHQASKVIKGAIRHIDDGVISPVVKETWLHIVLYDEPEEAGDIQVVARASEFLLFQEKLQMLTAQWLQMTANPVDMQIIGLLRRAKALREHARQLKLPPDSVPSDRELKQQIEQAKQQQIEQAQANAANQVEGPEKEREAA